MKTFSISTDPSKVYAKAYDMVLNGVEAGGGSLRIYQEDLQEKVFKAIGITEEEAQQKFGFLLMHSSMVHRRMQALHSALTDSLC